MNSVVESNKQIGRRGAQPGPLHRVSGDDAFAAREVLKQAFHLIEPANRTQRQLIRDLMPELFLLRNTGFSFEQLAQLLGEINIKLQPGTIRTYYSEMLAERMDACQERFNEQLMVLAEIKKETSGLDVASLAAKASAIMTQKMGQQSERINTVLGFAKAEAPSPSSSPQKTAARVTLEAPRANAAGPDSEDGESTFNLLVGSKPKTGTSHNFLDDGEPSVPRLGDPAAISPAKMAGNDHASENKHGAATPPSVQAGHSGEKNSEAALPPSVKPSILKCLPLKDGIVPLTPKKGIPDVVYQKGSLEHPAIPGLMLTLEERLYGAYLEIVETGSGDIRFEDLKEKSLRVLWRPKGTKSTSTTAGDFTPMNSAIFAKEHR
jgi:hypothetical protein